MRELLHPLQKYANNPPQEAPPEILPWDPEDPWGLDGAARAALGLLLAGEKPGPDLYAMGDYLLTFATPGYGARLAYMQQQDKEAFQRRGQDAFLLNGTALALCGYLCHGHHPQAELWRVSGCARLATVVHDRKADVSDAISAACLRAVCQVAAELDRPILADLITLRERMFGRLLDHSRAERLHVSEEAYPGYMADPVPADQVGALMRARTWQQAAVTPDSLREPDVAEADLACRNLLTLRAHMLVRHQFGSEIDWHLRLFDDKESTVSLNAHIFLRNLATVYAETGDDKYAVHSARLLWSWYRLNPIPNHQQWLGPWRTLEVGNRQCNMWPAVIGLMGDSEPFDAATHAMLARSRLEHIRYLLAFCGGPNNWYQVESAGLAVAALFSPELRHADAVLGIALRRLQWINSFAYYDDGFQFELTHGYHVFPTSSMFAVVQAAQARGVDLPKDFTALVERAHEMYLFARQPDFTLPTFNDCNPNPTDPARLLGAAAQAFDRDDFRWGATHGQEGAPPDHASHAWSEAGYYVMRDGWAEDGQYLFFDVAPWGASHQHEDKLTFVLHAHGRLLLGDPNIYSYAWTELTHYFKSSRAHNVVMIDGMGQARRFQPDTWLATRGRTEWISDERFDFASGEYVDGFAPDPFGERGQEQPIDRRFSQRRAIFYVKGEYWILCDLIRGADEEAHRLEQIFHVAPIYDPNAPEPLRAGQVAATSAHIVTQDAGLGNLAILPVDSTGLAVRAQKGETNPAVGWYGVLGEYPAWDVTLETQKALPARLDAVLFPLSPGTKAHPTVQRLRADEQATAFHIVGAGVDDTFVLCEEEAGPVTIGDIVFEGRALLLRRRPDVQALAVEPVSLQVAGETIQLAQQSP